MTATPWADDGAVILLRVLLSPKAEAVSWMDLAACAQTDPEAFFPDKGGSSAMAKAVCMRCEVRQPCLQYALDHDERFGLWGGKSDRERRAIRRQRRNGSKEQAA